MKATFTILSPTLVILLLTLLISCSKSDPADVPNNQTNASVSVTPATLSFDGVAPGQSLDRYITVSNTSTAAGNVSGTLNISGTGFSIVSGSPTFNLAKGQSTVFTVRFSPNASANFNGTVSISHNSSTVANPITVSLIGSTEIIKFEKNVLVEQYTGTWCGYCPRAIAQIDNRLVADNKIVHIALHLSDEMTFNLNNSLFTSFGFTGVPTVHVDRSLVWSGTISAITPLHSGAGAGLAINVSSANNVVSAIVKVKFGMSYTDNLKLSVYLLDDGKIANQVNYYNTDPSSPYYQKGAPIINLVHENVMLKTGTDMFGEAIPNGNIGTGKTYTRTIDFTGINPERIANMRVVAFITYANGSNIKKILNCIIGSVGENKDFVQLGS